MAGYWIAAFKGRKDIYKRQFWVAGYWIAAFKGGKDNYKRQFRVQEYFFKVLETTKKSKKFGRTAENSRFFISKINVYIKSCLSKAVLFETLYFVSYLICGCAKNIDCVTGLSVTF